MTLRTAVDIPGQEVLVTRPSKIRGLYFSSSHFPTDLLAAVPYRTIVLATGVLADPSSSEAAWLASWRPWLPLVSLLNLLRVARLLRMRPWQTLMRTYTSAQLFRLVALFLYLCHLTGCVYWYVSMVELRRGVARGVLVWGAAQNGCPPQATPPCSPRRCRCSRPTSSPPPRATSGRRTRTRSCGGY